MQKKEEDKQDEVATVKMFPIIPQSALGGDAGLSVSDLASSVKSLSIESKDLEAIVETNLEGIDIGKEKFRSAILYRLKGYNILSRTPMKVNANEVTHNACIIVLGKSSTPEYCLKITRKKELGSIKGSIFEERRKEEYTIAKILSKNEYFIKTEYMVFSKDGGTYQSEILMEYGGVSLWDPKSPDLDVWTVAAQLFEAMAFCHSNDIFHCDLKPGNVLWNAATKKIKIIDYDTSFQKPRGLLYLPTYDLAAVGKTMHFSPPELLNEEKKEYINEDKVAWPYKIDIYSAGMTVYSMLLKKTAEELTEEYKNKMLGEEQYNKLFMTKIRNLRKENKEENRRYNFMIEVLLACFEFSPLKRPSFDFLSKLFCHSDELVLPVCASCGGYKQELIKNDKSSTCKVCSTMDGEIKASKEAIEEKDDAGKAKVENPIDPHLNDLTLIEVINTVETLLLKGDKHYPLLKKEEKDKTKFDGSLACYRKARGYLSHKECNAGFQFLELILLKRLDDVCIDKDLLEEEKKYNKEFVELCTKTIGALSSEGYMRLKQSSQFSVFKFAITRPTEDTLEMLESRVSLGNWLGKKIDVYDYYHLGRWYYFLGKHEKALQYLDATIILCLNGGSLNNISALISDPKVNLNLLEPCLTYKGHILYSSFGPDETLETYSHAFEIIERTKPQTHPQYWVTLTNFCMGLSNKSLFERALVKLHQLEEIARKAPKQRKKAEACLFLELSRTTELVGNLKEAVEYVRKCLKLRLIKLGEDSADTAQAYNFLSKMLLLSGEYEEALSTCLEGKRIREKLFGTKRTFNCDSICQQAIVLHALGNYPESRMVFDEAIKTFKIDLVNNSNLSHAVLIFGYAQLLASEKKYLEALPYFDNTIKCFAKDLGESHPRSLRAKLERAYCISYENPTEALETLRDVIGVMDAREWVSHYLKGMALIYSGFIKYRIGKADEGIADVEAGKNIFSEKASSGHILLKRAKAFLTSPSSSSE